MCRMVGVSGLARIRDGLFDDGDLMLHRHVAHCSTCRVSSIDRIAVERGGAMRACNRRLLALAATASVGLAITPGSSSQPAAQRSLGTQVVLLGDRRTIPAPASTKYAV